MKKKFVITEEEKNEIKSLYNLTEQVSDNIIKTIIQKASEYAQNKLKSGSTENSSENSSDNNTKTDSSMIQTKTTSDDDFYKQVLSCVGAKPTKDNMSFMYAWRQAEGGKATNNPFNTTQKMGGATNYNSVGVKNYLTPEDGIKSTCKTLNNGRYNDIVNGLKNDVGLFELSRMKGLKTWGTGELLAKVADGYLKGSSPKPPAIA
jgi:hypothetical protein